MDARTKIDKFIKGELALKVSSEHNKNYEKLRRFIKRAFPKSLVYPSEYFKEVYFIEANLNNNNGNMNPFYIWEKKSETKLETITIDEFKMDCFGWFLDEKGQQIVIPYE
jgi:hypothetical protein